MHTCTLPLPLHEFNELQHPRASIVLFGRPVLQAFLLSKRVRVPDTFTIC